MIRRYHKPPRGRRHFARVGVGTALLAVIAWFSGLVWFVDTIAQTTPVPQNTTDAIVVLTGGSGRLEAGLDLLDQGWAGHLFVSGVYERVDVRLLLDAFKRQVPEIACCVELGYAATNTRGNAFETAAWVEREGYSSLRVVTSNYHMPRTLLEFGRIVTATLVPHPVQPETYEIARWWRSLRTFKLVAWEYSKFLTAVATGWLGVAPGGVDPHR